MTGLNWLGNFLTTLQFELNWSGHAKVGIKTVYQYHYRIQITITSTTTAFCSTIYISLRAIVAVVVNFI